MVFGVAAQLLSFNTSFQPALLSYTHKQKAVGLSQPGISPFYEITKNFLRNSAEGGNFNTLTSHWFVADLIIALL